MLPLTLHRRTSPLLSHGPVAVGFSAAATGSSFCEPTCPKLTAGSVTATLAYRATRTIENAPDDFGNLRASPTGRSAAGILSHMNDLLNWFGWMARGEPGGPRAMPGEWVAEVRTFYDRLAAFDSWLAEERPIACDPLEIVQGPIADSLTHVRQLAMLRRIAGAPVVGEDYSIADIRIGQVGPEQSAPRKTFD